MTPIRKRPFKGGGPPNRGQMINLIRPNQACDRGVGHAGRSYSSRSAHGLGSLRVLRI
ncbi:hypothetical protein SBV1_2910009 [Verrucomicrobia bacterium]|nr:hypothetical protein SBV1_2910009 [Verrucomicrobiota bacterium]